MNIIDTRTAEAIAEALFYRETLDAEKIEKIVVYFDHDRDGVVVEMDASEVAFYPATVIVAEVDRR